MPQTLLTFDFGTNEEAAQQARHRIEGWRQAFRLGDRMKFKFERQAAEPPAEAKPSPEPEPPAPKSAKAKTKKKTTKSTKKKKEEPAAAPEPEPTPADRLRLMVRLDFSGHEKLSYQRWLDRLRGDAPFDAAEKKIVQRGEEGYETVEEKFDSLP